MEINKSLVLYRNELKNSKLPKYKLIGIISDLVLSKHVFPKNIDIKIFLFDILGIELKDYLYKSRTLLVARITREVISKELTSKQLKLLYNFVGLKIDEDKGKNQLDGWL